MLTRLDVYRVFHQLAAMEGLTLILAVPLSAYADGILAEMADQPGKMLKQPKSKSTKPESAS